VFDFEQMSAAHWRCIVGRASRASPAEGAQRAEAVNMPQMFMPHGMCYLWDPRLVFAHVTADGLIAAAYFFIPLFILWLVGKRRDLPFSWIFVLFALFIVSCGTTHLFSIWVIWHPNYWTEAAVKWVTAVASVATAIALVPLAPKVLAFQSRAQALEALSESEARFRIFLQTVPQMVWTANSRGEVDWYNERWFDYTGQSAADASGWGWRAVHHPDDAGNVMAQWTRSLATGEAFEMEFRLRGKDGNYRWFLTRSVPERRDGAIVRWYGSSTDVDAQFRLAERTAQIAGTWQHAFLTKKLPADQRVEFDALYVPAETDALVGGDWYDALRLSDGRILISCGDVEGHGIEAALRASRFRQSISVIGTEEPDTARIMARLNRSAITLGDGLATAVIGVYEPAEQTLQYCIAGHPPPVIASGDGARGFLELGGLPLGLDIDASWTSHAIALHAGSVVVFYTDGVTEFERDINTAERRLLDAAASIAACAKAEQIAETVKRRVMQDARSNDDVAILVLRCLGHGDGVPPPGTPAVAIPADPLTMF
jgi:PAS domain S-box-containing protein